MIGDYLLERAVLPDWLIRAGIRRLLHHRLTAEYAASVDAQDKRLTSLIETLRTSPIASHTDKANEQHYELPAEFFRLVLGKRMKYSSAYYTLPSDSLDEAEETMLSLTCSRAGLADGMKILELGCGWGSLTLFMAERFPGAAITAVSNSATQRTYIEREIGRRGLTNVAVVTADMNVFSSAERYDRAVSVEMFEHMRNYHLLMKNIAGWLRPGGKLFVHIFTHREVAYPFEVRDDTDWMAKYFFTGGIMPSDALLLSFNDDLVAERHWRLSGTHYQKTAEAWLANMDRCRKEIFPLLAVTYGKHQALKWWVYWRVFFMACAELWGYRDGREWGVSHYLFVHR
jgi:cyclopropane-fatty-acyl-phospholipid synthase